MQYCNNCHSAFFESNGLRGDALDGYQCPWCGETEDIEEMSTCAQCGDCYIAEPMDGGLCPACRDEARRLYRRFWAALPKAYRDFVLDTDYHPADEREMNHAQSVVPAVAG